MTDASKKQPLEFHPAANIFPCLADQKLQDLADDIKLNGLLVPIELFEGKIIDGRNRWNACKMAGVEPEFVETDCNGDPIAYVMSLNLHRRHLNESQRAMVGGRAKDYYAQEAKERQGTRTDLANIPANLPGSGDARDKAAAALNVSGRSVDAASTVLLCGVQELKNAVDSGAVTVSAAAEIAKLPKKEQAAVVQEGPDAVRDKAALMRAQRRKVQAEKVGHYDNLRATAERIATLLRGLRGDDGSFAHLFVPEERQRHDRLNVAGYIVSIFDQFQKLAQEAKRHVSD